MIKIGYACLTIGVPKTNMRTTIMKNATPELLYEIIDHNLKSLENMLIFNQKHNIKLFRISSDLIPFGSSPINQLEWADLFAEQFAALSDLIHTSGMRVSMHPGQYTVLNSPREDVVTRAVEDLDYHCKVLDALGLDASHKIILHIGGAYGQKEEAIRRFNSNYGLLDQKIKNRLVIENDERIYNIEEVVSIGKTNSIPVIFDLLHYQINKPDPPLNALVWIERSTETWGAKDGCPKIHYSQQKHGARTGAHSNTIQSSEFLEFYQQISHLDLDVMLEVKDKNLSAVKCNLLCTSRYRVINIEEEWSRYKYQVLEKSPQLYLEIRALLKEKNQNITLEFYNLLEQAQETPTDTQKAINTLEHIWGYFKNKASQQEKKRFLENLEKYNNGTIKLKSIKNQLFKLATKYEESYLIYSLYFYLDL